MVTYGRDVTEDDVFRALADPTRRQLLDALFADDGQTLTSLEARFEMTRFGVMKHLKVLEEAGLVVTRRAGREKRHHLNPVPIRLVHDRWVSKYAEPWAAGLSGGLKERMDQLEMHVLKEAMIRHRWNKSRAARELGLSRVGLRAKLVRHGLEQPE